jgi:primase-polymerase (primpol)-like protein
MTYAQTPGRRDTVKVLTRAVVLQAREVRQLRRDGHEIRGRVGRVEVRASRAEASNGGTAELWERTDDLNSRVGRLERAGPPMSTAAATADRPARPQALPVRFDAIPAELAALPAVVWRYQLRGGKWTKPPRSPGTGGPASTTDPETWGTFGEARAAYLAGGWDGIGAIHLPGHGVTGLDFDHVRDPATGRVYGPAAEPVRRLDSYAEVSPSGTGLRAYAGGRKPGPRCNTLLRGWPGKVELYDGRTADGKPGGRFLTITGWRLGGSPAAVHDRQAVVNDLYREWFGAADAPRPAAAGSGLAGTDAELVARASAARNGTKFARLWAGDASGYESESEADLALCGLLRFWVGRDAARIDALFRQSGLCDEKWQRRDYRDRTIARALAGDAAVYTPPRPRPPRRRRRPAHPVTVITFTIRGDEL